MSKWVKGAPTKKGRYCLVYRDNEGKPIVFDDTIAHSEPCNIFFDIDRNKPIKVGEILAHKKYPSITNHWLKHLGVKDGTTNL